MTSCSADLAFRGLVHQVSDEGLFARLDEGGVVAYVGFDPTADSLHVGNLLQLCNLRRLQAAGNRPIVLAGGATGLIGDPGGKTDERQLLSPEQIAANLEGIQPQLERFLDFSSAAGPSKALLFNNSTWLSPLPLIDFLRDVGKHFTVNQMVAKDSVRNRFDRPEQGISYTEFSYMLLQAVDFLHLYDIAGCELQMGASDQWGNITMGLELIRKVRGARAFALTSPLVLKSDGSKFGKSESGALYLDARRTSPFELYQHFVRTEDSLVGTYLRYFTFTSHDELLALDQATAERPGERAAQRRLASDVVELVHGRAEVERVERAVGALYSEEIAALDEATLLMVLDDAPSSHRSRDALFAGQVDLVDLLVESGLVKSKTVARTMLSQGGAYVNNRRVSADGSILGPEDLIADRYLLLRRGRRDLHLVEFD